MTFQQLQYVLEVYRAGSISQAAKKLFVGQSSVSICISNLENELGYPIFVRSKNGTQPTPRGMSVIEHANRICESYRLITGPGTTSVTYVRIGCTGYEPAQQAFLRLVSENQGRSDVSFSMSSHSLNDMIENVSLFELDIGLCFVFAPRIHSVESRFRKKGLQWRVLKEVPVVIHIGAGHRLYNQPVITPKDLENDVLIDTSQKEMANSPFLNGIIPTPPHRIISVNSSELRKTLVSQGFGFSIGRMYPEHVSQQYGIRNIPLEGISFKLVAISNPLRGITPEIRRFSALLDEELAKV